MDPEVVAQKLKSNLLKKSEKEVIDLVKENILSGDLDKINRKLIEHPAKYAFYIGMYAVAKADTVKTETVLQDVFNSLSIQVRRRMSKEKIKPTETQIKAIVELQSKYQEIRKIYLNKLESEKMLQAMVKSLEQSKDCLWNLATNVRSEMSSGITIKKDNTDKIAQTLGGKKS